jgi:hypothetical protein
LWFACAPVDLQGKKLTFTISTTKGPLTKEVTMPAGKGEFKPGVVAIFNINMEGIEFEKSVKYELVTDASELAVGDEIIIAAADYAKALSTTQNTNNRGNADVTKDGDYIKDPSTAVQIITLEDGTTTGTFAFNVGGGYLYAASGSSNQLKTQTSNNANGSWKIEIADNGVATIKAQGTNSRNWLRYNPTNNTGPIFSCYASGQSDVAIYKLPNTKPAIVASNIEVDEFGVENETASYDVKNMEDDVTVQSVSADWVTASASEKTIKYSVESNYDGETRTAQIVLASASTGVTKTITVTQAADKFAVSVTAITLDAEKGAKATFTVTSSYEYSVSNPDSSKLSVVKGDNGVITVTALIANDLAEVLSIGNIVVSRSVDTTTLKVAVSQKAAEQGGGDEPEQTTPKFVKVTSTAGLTDGQYLIVCESKKAAFNGSLSTLDATNNYTTVSISNNEIEATDALKAIVFTYNSTDKTLKSASGYYIGKTASGNGLNSNKSTKYTNTITISSGVASITSSAGPTLQFNSANDQMRFRYYKSVNQTAVSLYKLQ